MSSAFSLTSLTHETTNSLIYYSGYNDEAKCYFCELIVQSWEAHDDPWEEHYKHYPDCGFLRQFYANNKQCTKRDTAFSNPPSTAKFMEKNDETKYSHRTSLSSTQKSAMVEILRAKLGEDEKDILSDIIEEIDRAEQISICKICLNDERDVTIVPCGHFVCCQSCSSSLRQCPICRTTISSILKTHMS